MKRSKRFLFFAALAAALFFVSLASYSCAAKSALKREVAEAERDPETGIIRGTEPKTLPGTGKKACLLVHGWVGSPIDFNNLGERLCAEGVTARLMLLPGHGTTPMDLQDKGIVDFLDALREELAELKKNYEDVTLIGFSLGGALSTILTAQDPPDRLVLVAPFFEVTYQFYYVFSPGTWNRLLSPFVEYVVKGESFIRVNREEVKSKIFSYMVIPTRAVTVLCDAGKRAGNPEILKKVTCPVLVLHSHGDMAASPEAAVEAFHELGSQDKELHLFHRSNHHLLWDFDSEEVMRLIIGFVKES